MAGRMTCRRRMARLAIGRTCVRVGRVPIFGGMTIAALPAVMGGRARVARLTILVAVVDIERYPRVGCVASSALAGAMLGWRRMTTRAIIQTVVRKQARIPSINGMARAALARIMSPRRRMARRATAVLTCVVKDAAGPWRWIAIVAVGALTAVMSSRSGGGMATVALVEARVIVVRVAPMVGVVAVAALPIVMAKRARVAGGAIGVVIVVERRLCPAFGRMARHTRSGIMSSRNLARVTLRAIAVHLMLIDGCAPIRRDVTIEARATEVGGGRFSRVARFARVLSIVVEPGISPSHVRVTRAALPSVMCLRRILCVARLTLIVAGMIEPDRMPIIRIDMARVTFTRVMGVCLRLRQRVARGAIDRM